MSSGPTLIGETCIESTKMVYLNVTFSKEDWCGYKGHCRVNQLLTDKMGACILCKYRTPLDIPNILEKENTKRNAEI